jgi:hypothetical protein
MWNVTIKAIILMKCFNNGLAYCDRIYPNKDKDCLFWLIDDKLVGWKRELVRPPKPHKEVVLVV